MEKDIVEGNIGAEANYNIDFVDGKIKAEVKYEGKEAAAGLMVEFGLVEVLKKAAEQSDNKIDDAIVKMVEAALA